MIHAALAHIRLGWDEADDAVVGALLGPARTDDVGERDIDVRFRRRPVRETADERDIIAHNDARVFAGRVLETYLVCSPQGRIFVDAEGNVDLDPSERLDVEVFVSVDLSIALALALRRLDAFHLHGALVSLGDLTVLLCARAEGGKSTTMLALVAAGALPWTDDVTYLVGQPDGAVFATGLGRSLHVSATTWTAFASLLGGNPPLATGRSTMHLLRPAVAPSRARPIDAVVAIEVVEAARSTFARLDAAETLGVALEGSVWAAQDRMTRADRHLEVLAAAMHGAVGLRAACGRDVLETPHEFADQLRAAITRD